MIINTVALLDKNTSDQIQGIMDELAVISDNDRALRFPPHFTLRFRYEIYDDKFESLCDDISVLVKNVKLPISFNATQIDFTPWNAVWLTFDITKEIQELHEEIMEIGQKYRTDFIPEDLINHPTIDEKQKEYVQKYGYHLAFEYFAPHITLAGGKIEDRNMEKVTQYNYQLPISGSIEKVGIYRMRDDANWVIEKEF